MTIFESVPNFFVITSTWSADWAWGLPLIVLTVVIHVLGLGLIKSGKVIHAYNCFKHQRHQTAVLGNALPDPVRSVQGSVIANATGVV